AAGDDGLQLLGAHDGARAVGGDVVVVVHQHAGVDQVLAAGADAGHAGILVADLGAQQVLGLARALAPDAASVAQLDLAVVHEHVGGTGGLAGDDHTVVAGFLEGAGPEAAGGRAAER